MLLALLLRGNVNPGPLAVLLGAIAWAGVLYSWVVEWVAKRKQRRKNKGSSK
jgi:hypothetical protein